MDGRVVLRDGRTVGVDEAGIKARASAAAERLAHGNRTAFELARRPSPFIGAACRATVAEPYPIDRYAGGATTTPPRRRWSSFAAISTAPKALG